MKRISVILFAGALAGCDSLYAPTAQQAQTGYQVQSTEQRASGLKEVRSWNASGAISIQQAPKSPVIMHFEWRQTGPDNYRVDLAASLNLVAVSISGAPHKVTLQKGNEPPISAATPEMLMRRNLGWALPIPSLWYWARSLPAPGPVQGVQYDKYGHLVFLQQNGWRATFGDYHTVQGVDLPGIIELKSGNISARIVFKQWQINH